MPAGQQRPGPGCEHDAVCQWPDAIHKPSAGGVSEALAVLSLEQIRGLVDTASVGTTFNSIPGVNLQQFWRYSLDTAKVARSLAACVKQNQAMAYSAGLVHAVVSC